MVGSRNRSGINRPKGIRVINRNIVLYCIVFAARAEPKSYDGARVLEASSRPMLVIGRSYGVGSIHGKRERNVEQKTGGTETVTGGGTITEVAGQ